MKIDTYLCDLCDKKIKVEKQNFSTRTMPKNSINWIEFSSEEVWITGINDNIHICSRCKNYFDKAKQLGIITKYSLLEEMQC